MLVSGWQDVNIGDIAHTPGLLHVFDTFFPGVEVILWKKSTGAAVQELLHTYFPRVQIVYGQVDEGNKVDNAQVKKAIEKADLMVHGSGPSVVGIAQLQAWIGAVDKPYGIFGTTIQSIDPALKAVLKKALFVYTRETASLQVLAREGITGKHVAFAPDATFYLNIFNHKKAEAFLAENGLEKGKYICAIPRLRYTPYHQFSAVNWTQEWIDKVTRVNEQHKEEDHAKLRQAMIQWVRRTGNKVLVCPEMTYQVELLDELLIDPLPEDVKPFVVKRGYWLTDEAAGVYARAHSVLSFECHSPIMAAASGVPFLYLRQPEDTIKGQMYYDLGLDGFIFEIDQTTGEQIAQRLEQIWGHYPKAKMQIRNRLKAIRAIYRQRTTSIEKQLQNQPGQAKG